jgi:UbiD family decarboxylase
MDDRTAARSVNLLERYREARRHARGYNDLHEHVLALAQAGLLVVVDEPINKDTEMHPLVRWQYRGGIPESERKAFLFTQPTDSKGRRFDSAVLVAGLAANRDVYRIGFGKPLEKIGETWIEAIAHPIAPRVVNDAACQEIVATGDDLDRDGAALDGLPVPISTPGFDNAPYLSAGHYITKDPDTGIQNVGNYRGQLKAPRRLGMNPSVELRAGIFAHWQKCKTRGMPLTCAVVIGCPPVISYASVQKMPENLDELAVAGALAGGPINVVRAKTVDLLVPAEAEIVIEGLINTELLEPEAPFGESHGYVNLQEYNAFMDVTAVTRRRYAILTSFISQVTPSESSVIRRVAMEPVYLHHLRTVLAIKGVTRVAMHEPLTSLYAVIAIQFARGAPESEIWRALYGASALGSLPLTMTSPRTMPMHCSGPCPIAASRSMISRSCRTRTPATDRADHAMMAQPQPSSLMQRSRRRLHRSHCPNANSWRTRERSGSGSAYRRSRRNRPGTAMTSAIGRRSWNGRRRWPCAANISSSGAILPTSAAAMSR